MNIFSGIIEEINSHEGISIVNIRSGDLQFKSVILDDASTLDYLKVGNPVRVLFKETEVIIVNQQEDNISLRNRIKCTIHSIDRGVLLSKLELEHDSQKVYSILTTEAVEKLELKIGDKVTAMIKTNEIMISA
jgi:molybdopterin-binding protein